MISFSTRVDVSDVVSRASILCHPLVSQQSTLSSVPRHSLSWSPFKLSRCLWGRSSWLGSCLRPGTGSGIGSSRLARVRLTWRSTCWSPCLLMLVLVLDLVLLMLLVSSKPSSWLFDKRKISFLASWIVVITTQILGYGWAGKYKWWIRLRCGGQLVFFRSLGYGMLLLVHITCLWCITGLLYSQVLEHCNVRSCQVKRYI